MQLICPKCSSKFNLEDAVAELEQREVRDTAAKLSGHWQITYEYTDCFRSSEYGDIRPKTRWRLLKEISRLFGTLTFQLKGKRYRTDRQKIVNAMTIMCNASKWSIKNHRYLLTILTETAERLSAEGLTAKEEQEREERRAEGREHSEEEFLGLSAEGRRQKVLGILNNIGRE